MYQVTSVVRHVADKNVMGTLALSTGGIKRLRSISGLSGEVRSIFSIKHLSTIILSSLLNGWFSLWFGF